MNIEKELQPGGWFYKRGIDPDVVRERPYVSVDGGFQIRKHPVPGASDDVLSQYRPDVPPVTDVTYHRHDGGEHVMGTGCPCGARRHKRARTDPPYSNVERHAHEGGKAHTQPDPVDGEVKPTVGWHRHTTEAKYLLSKNRDWQEREHTHRTFLPRGFEPRADVLSALIQRPRQFRNAKLAELLGTTVEAVENARDLARHVRQPDGHPRGGHDGECDLGLDEWHPHLREVKESLRPETVDFEPHRDYAQHGKKFKDGRPHAGEFDKRCRRCVTERHVREEHLPQGVPIYRSHTHIRTARVPLPSTEKRLDVHPRTRARLKAGERSARAFFSIEGTAKCDSLVSRGEVAFDVPSVTMWRTEDDELERFAGDYLQGTVLFVVPDSDWASNPAVAFQAFECREFLRRILGEVEVHVAAAPSKKDGDKNGVDDWLGERELGSLRNDPDNLVVLDRHESDGFLAWASEYRAEYKSDRAETDVGVMEWFALHAAMNGEVKRSVTSIQEYLARNGRPIGETALYNAVDRLLTETFGWPGPDREWRDWPVLETVPPGIDLKKITRIRRTRGGKSLYLGEDWGDGDGEGRVTFRIGAPLLWTESRSTVARTVREVQEFVGEEWGIEGHPLQGSG
jgi:hypothetical protein